MKMKLELIPVTMVALADLTGYTMFADQPFYRSPAGKIMIPGSTVKGVIRTLFTQKIAEKEKLSLAKSDEAQKAENKAAQLFGSEGYSQPLLRVTPFTPHPEEPPPTVVTRIKVNPFTGRVEEKKLFQVEYLPPCTRFHGEIRLRTAPLYRLGEKAPYLILTLLEAVESLRYNRLGRGDSIYDLKLVNPEEVQPPLEKLFSETHGDLKKLQELIEKLSSFYWKDRLHEICKEGENP